MAEQLYFSRDTKLIVEYPTGSNQLWEIPILDGYSFSQANNSSEITLSEMQGTVGTQSNASRRGKRLFNDSLAPAEWSFSTYVRPFLTAGTASPPSADSVASQHHAIEKVLWGMMGAADTYASFDLTRTTDPLSGAGPDAVTTSDGTDMNVSFDQTNRAVFPTATFYFLVTTADSANLCYKLTNAVINEATIDFDVDGIAMINWSGFAKQIVDFTDNIARQAAEPDDADFAEGGQAVAVGDLWVDSDNADAVSIMTDVTTGAPVSVQAIDEGISATTNFIRNRLSTVTLTASDTTSYPGVSSNGVYNMTLTGGSLTFSNNVSYLTPEEIGLVNIPIEHVMGNRSVSGTVTCYMTVDDDGSNLGTSSAFFNDLAAATSVVTNSWIVLLNIGGTSAPNLQFDMQTAHFEIPQHSIEDVISLETSFTGLPQDIGDTDEVVLVYKGIAL